MPSLTTRICRPARPNGSSPRGFTGAPDPVGPQGPIGETGPVGPQDGPNSGSDISRTGPNSFNLAQIGTYQILFEVSVDEAGQLMLTLNGEDLTYTVAGRAAHK